MPRFTLFFLLPFVTVTTGCGPFSRAALFSDAPSFVLDAHEDGGLVDLVARGFDPDDTEDDLCGEDDGESCEDDLFLGFFFYRSEGGPYGEYSELGVSDVPEWLDQAPGEDTAWRCALLRQEGDDSPRLEEVSIAAFLPGGEEG